MAAAHLRHLPLVSNAVSRTSVPTPGSPAGTPTAATPRRRSSQRTSPTSSLTHWSDAYAAPLLCAGIIGYRALRLSQLPPSGRLGLYGFGASAHLTAQVAMNQGATVHVMTRSTAARQLALQLGCSSAGDTFDAPPEPLDAAIIFAPAGEIVPAALAALDDAGTLAIAGIHLSDIPELNYQQHLFRERTVRSVTANTRSDGEEFLRVAASMQLQVHHQEYPLAKPTAPWPTWPPTASTAQPCSPADPPPRLTQACRVCSPLTVCSPTAQPRAPAAGYWHRDRAHTSPPLAHRALAR